MVTIDSKISGKSLSLYPFAKSNGELGRGHPFLLSIFHPVRWRFRSVVDVYVAHRWDECVQQQG